jgi:predicted nucleic acid-binding Zn ribbon protein
MKDEPLKICPECGKTIRRLINGGNGVIFKGSGFYVTDKNGKGGKADDGKTGESKTAKTGAAESAPCPGCAKAETSACPIAANS